MSCLLLTQANDYRVSACRNVADFRTMFITAGEGVEYRAVKNFGLFLEVLAGLYKTGMTKPLALFPDMNFLNIGSLSTNTSFLLIQL